MRSVNSARTWNWSPTGTVWHCWLRPRRFFGAPFPTLTLSQEQALADAEIDALLDRFRPSQVVAIERPGSAADGHRYSMRGEILDDLVPAADRLLTPPTRRDYETLAIGDGGNELGLGALRERLKGQILHGEPDFRNTGGLRHPGRHFQLGGIRPRRWRYRCSAIDRYFAPPSMNATYSKPCATRAPSTAAPENANSRSTVSAGMPIQRP